MVTPLRDLRSIVSLYLCYFLWESFSSVVSARSEWWDTVLVCYLLIFKLAGRFNAGFSVTWKHQIQDLEKGPSNNAVEMYAVIHLCTLVKAEWYLKRPVFAKMKKSWQLFEVRRIWKWYCSNMELYNSLYYIVFSWRIISLIFTADCRICWYKGKNVSMAAY